MLMISIFDVPGVGSVSVYDNFISSTTLRFEIKIMYDDTSIIDQVRMWCNLNSQPMPSYSAGLSNRRLLKFPILKRLLNFCCGGDHEII